MPILLIPSVFAAFTEVSHDAWHYANESFKVGTMEVKLGASSSQETISLSAQDKTYLIANKTCEETSQYFFCVDNTQQGGFDYYWRVYKLKYKVRILQKLAKLELSRTVSRAEFFSGQDAEVSLSFKNSGSFAATSLHVEDNMPGFNVIQATTCKSAGQSVVWDGSLLPEQEIDCSYKIRAVESSSLKSKAVATYFNGKASVTSSSAELILKSYANELSLTAPSSLDLQVGSSKIVQIMLNNTVPKDITVKSLTATIPYGISVTKFLSWDRVHDYKFVFSGTIPARSVKYLNLTFVAEQQRPMTLGLNLQFVVDTISRSASRNVSIISSIPNLTILYQFPLLFQVNKSAHLLIRLTNPSNLQDFKAVDAKVLIPCLNISISKKYNEIQKELTVDILDTSIMIPSANACSVQTTVSYETSFGQLMKIVKQSNFSVAAAPQAPNLSATPINSSQIIAPSTAQTSNAKKGFNFNYVFAGFGFLAFVLVIVWLRKRSHKVISKEEAALVTKELKPEAQTRPQTIASEQPKKKGKKQPKVEHKRAKPKVVESPNPTVIEPKTADITETSEPAEPKIELEKPKKPTEVTKPQKNPKKQPSFRF
ncbi:MAG: hypothetical protein V1837_06635 [Candidatus Woesearchaeota archaeon]